MLKTKKQQRWCGYTLLGIGFLMFAPLVLTILGFLLALLFSIPFPYLSQLISLLGTIVSFFAGLLSIVFLAAPDFVSHPLWGYVALGLLYLVSLVAYFYSGVIIIGMGLSLLEKSKGVVTHADKSLTVLSGFARRQNKASNTIIFRSIDTDTKACRACGTISLLLAATLVLPVAWFQVTRVLFRGEMTTLVDIWVNEGANSGVIPALITLILLVLMTIVALVIGKVFFDRARKIREGVPIYPLVRQHCEIFLNGLACLLLLILPISFLFFSLSSSSSASSLSFGNLFLTIDGSWREAQATFQRLQFRPLFVLGIIAVVLAKVMHSDDKTQV